MSEPDIPTSLSRLHEDIFVARQPIFAADRSLWGYELLFRDSGSAEFAYIQDPDAATTQVIAEGFVLARASLARNLRSLVNFPERMLLDRAALAMPPDTCVVEVLESVPPTPEVLEALRRLREGGYTLALDDYTGQPHLAPFLDLMHIVKVDFAKLGYARKDIMKVTSALRQEGRLLLAEKVESPQDFEFARMLGFNLLQGFFFAIPEIIPGRKISSAETARLRLLHELSTPDYDVRRLAGIIESDVSLTYRLFRYVNSAMFSPGLTVDSVERAIILLGYRQLSAWLRVVLMTDTATSAATRELVHQSACRARFLEQLCHASDACQHPPDSFFLLGMFSLLDALLGLPMAEVLAHMPLPPSLAEALTRKTSELSPWLALAKAYERHDWGQAIPLLMQYRLDFQRADRLYVQAQAWAQDILSAASEIEAA